MLGLFLIAGILFWMLYKYWVSVYKFWEQRGMPYLPGSFPFGTDMSFSLLTKFQGHRIQEMYKKTAPRPYFGIYCMRIPFLVIRDPEIISLVLAKDFSHFRDRQGFTIPKNDYLSHNLFNLEGERWRALRVKMSPTFTSGKIKGMYPLFIRCAKELESLLLSKLESTVDIKDFAARFTTDVICSCAFGLEVNSTKNSDIPLRKMGSNFMTMKLSSVLRMGLLRSFPFLLEYMPFRLVQKEFEKYLMKLIKETVDHRTKTHIKRGDFLDLLIELKEKGRIMDDTPAEEDQSQNHSVEMTYELMAAQCFVFFIAGFETSSSVQSYCLYELALNPDIQERLRKEIDTTLTKHSDLTYEAIQEMEYLDMVVHETMRKYPTLPFLTRRCSKTFSMPAGNSIYKGDRILIPVWALHHDPDLFPNPDKFNPERFSQENKSSIKPYSYLPFGEGPRICIGMRFGLLQTKVGLVTILKKYKVSPSEKTSIPLEFKGSFLVTTTKGPILLKISDRSAK